MSLTEQSNMQQNRVNRAWIQKTILRFKLRKKMLMTRRHFTESSILYVAEKRSLAATSRIKSIRQRERYLISKQQNQGTVS